MGRRIFCVSLLVIFLTLTLTLGGKADAQQTEGQKKGSETTTNKVKR